MVYIKIFGFVCFFFNISYTVGFNLVGGVMDVFSESSFFTLSFIKVGLLVWLVLVPTSMDFRHLVYYTVVLRYGRAFLPRFFDVDSSYAFFFFFFSHADFL